MNPAKPLTPSSDADHDTVQAILHSDAWKEKLRVARLKREKVLAERAVANSAASAGKLDQRPKSDCQQTPYVWLPTIYNPGVSPRSDEPTLGEPLNTELPSNGPQIPVVMEESAASLGRSLMAAGPSRPSRVRVPVAVGIALVAGLTIGLVLSPLAQAIRSGRAALQTLPTVISNSSNTAAERDDADFLQARPVTRPSTLSNLARSEGEPVKPPVWIESPPPPLKEVSKPQGAIHVSNFGDARPPVLGQPASDGTFLGFASPVPDQLNADLPAAKTPHQGRLFAISPLISPAMSDQTGAVIAHLEDSAVAALVAEADAAYSAALGLDGADKKQELLKVKLLLDKIASDYPASQASLSVALGEKIGTIDPVELDTELAALPVDAATAADGREKDATTTSDPLADPLLKLIGQCLRAPNLPVATVGDAKVKLRLQTGPDGAIGGMPDLIEPSLPTEPERQLFNRSLLALGACIQLTAAQRNSTIEFSVSAHGISDGAVLHTEAVPVEANVTIAASKIFVGAAGSTQEPTVNWMPATAESQEALKLKRKDIAEIQARLLAMSYDPKGIDGAAGAGLRGAVRLWQSSAGIPSTGYFDADQLARLTTDSQSAFDIWKGDSSNAKVLLKASNPPTTRKSTSRRGHNGWYRAANGNYCRMGVWGLWCQIWKPVAW